MLIKSDTQGMLEAVSSALSPLGEDKASLKVVRSGIGDVTQSDVFLADATKSVILGFGVREHRLAIKAAKQARVKTFLFSTIHEAQDKTRSLLEEIIPPEIEEHEIGRVEARKIIKSSKLGKIAGCMVVSGRIRRNAQIRVSRDGVVIWQGPIRSLRRFEDEATEVLKNFECGLRLDGFSAPEVGDVFNVIERRKIRHKLGGQEAPNEKRGNRRNKERRGRESR